jgi:UDP-N-acetylglucosamine diphosphorylase/glucosamine-1-phosphate N-acetyltransferase
MLAQIAMVGGGLILGLGVGIILFKYITDKKISDSKGLAERIVEEARKESEALKKESRLQAQDEIFNQKKELERDFKDRESQLKSEEKRLHSKEERLDAKREKVADKEAQVVELEKQLIKQEKHLSELEEDLVQKSDEHERKLQEISGLTVEEARENLLKVKTIGPLLEKLQNTNNSGEYYITDLVGLAVEKGLSVDGVQAGNDVSLMGINSPRELIDAETTLRARIVDELIDSGVLVHNPGTVIVGPRAEIEPGAEIFGHCEIYGASKVAAGARLGSYNHITDATFAPGCVVREFNHIEGAEVGEGVTVGPYSRLRPGAKLEKDARIGNFVEMKKATLGEGAKASHLTYLGDAVVGAGANIGAGTITCNYDGKNKFTTRIGAGAFIGSNTALVAPVSVGDNALIGAGSTITKDVPDNQTGIARGKQVNLRRSLKKN